MVIFAQIRQRLWSALTSQAAQLLCVVEGAGRVQSRDMQSLLGKEIRQLNRKFLTLVNDRSDPGNNGGDRLGLPRRLAARLTCLGTGETERMVNCSYALFEITIPMDAQRQSMLAVADSATDTATCPGALVMFKLLALMWQRALLRHDETAAQLTFGLMSAEVRELDRMSLDGVVRLAATAPALLRFRFAEHPSFWPDLIHLAAHGADRQLAAVHLAGQQWIAARIAGHVHWRHVHN